MKLSITIRFVSALLAFLLFVLLAPACFAQMAITGSSPEGALLRPLVGQERLLTVNGDEQFTFSENNHTQSLLRSYGSGSLPVVPADEGLNLNNVELYIHKDVQGSALLGYGPLPGVAPTQASWGYNTQTVVGRAAGSLFGGWDLGWGINHRSATDHNTTASNLIVPSAYAAAYVPVLGGLNFFGGFIGAGIGHEVHSNPRAGPNQFATHTYSLIAHPDLVLGGLASGSFFRNQRGALAWELGINSGIETVRSPNGTPAFQAALRYRTPDFKTQLDYETFLANGEIRTGRNVQTIPGPHGTASFRRATNCTSTTASRWPAISASVGVPSLNSPSAISPVMAARIQSLCEPDWVALWCKLGECRGRSDLSCEKQALVQRAIRAFSRCRRIRTATRGAL